MTIEKASTMFYSPARLCRFLRIVAFPVWLALSSPGCREERLVVYCSVDETFARSILDLYQQRSGQAVDVVFDSEAGKTTGLVRRIRAEQGRPRADVFWSSELINTILLARDGLLDTYDSPVAAELPPQYRDTKSRWSGCALRARVLAYDPKHVRAEELPSTWQELSEPHYASRLALANPLFGTTRAHVAAMFALWGEERGRAFLTALRDGGALITDGNSAAVRKVMSGEARMAMTDSDDVYAANRQGEALEMRYLDMGDGGTVLVPCSVAKIAGAAHPDEADRLIDFLISSEVEELLYRSESGNIPVRESLRRSLGCTLPPASSVSFDAMADAMETSAAAVREILIR